LQKAYKNEYCPNDWGMIFCFPVNKLTSQEKTNVEDLEAPKFRKARAAKLFLSYLRFVLSGSTYCAGRDPPSTPTPKGFLYDPLAHAGGPPDSQADPGKL
jgi:hypothetical protein